jgi:hypothetical protein
MRILSLRVSKYQKGWNNQGVGVEIFLTHERNSEAKKQRSLIACMLDQQLMLFGGKRHGD